MAQDTAPDDRIVARRELLIAGSVCLLAWPLAGPVHAAGRAYRIGWLAYGQPLPGGPYHQFLQRAKELGYVEGQNLAVDFRGFLSVDEARTAAADLARAKVDLIVAQAPDALRAARTATRSVPIVAFFVDDPVRMGMVQSLARPGGNVTGFTWDTGPEGAGKSLQLIKEMLPRASRIAVLWNRANDSHPYYLQELETYARTLGLTVLSLGVNRTEELDGAFARIAREQVNAVMIFSDPFTIRNRERLTALLDRHPVAALWGSTAWPLLGAVVTFGPNVTDHPPRAAEYMDRIFRGASPATLPFQQPTRFDLVLNTRVARSLGLTIPSSLLLRADQVVEQ